MPQSKPRKTDITRKRNPRPKAVPDDLQEIRLLNEEQVSSLLQVPVSTLRQRRYEGVGLPYVTVPGSGKAGSVRYRLADIKRLLAERLVLPSVSERVEAVHVDR